MGLATWREFRLGTVCSAVGTVQHQHSVPRLVVSNRGSRMQRMPSHDQSRRLIGQERRSRKLCQDRARRICNTPLSKHAQTASMRPADVKALSSAPTNQPDRRQRTAPMMQPTPTKRTGRNTVCDCVSRSPIAMRLSSAPGRVSSEIVATFRQPGGAITARSMLFDGADGGYSRDWLGSQGSKQLSEASHGRCRDDGRTTLSPRV